MSDFLRIPSPLARLCAAVLAAFLVLLATATRTWAEFPQSQGYVTDSAHLLDASAKSTIESVVRDTERQTSAEIAVVTVSSLDGMTVEEYANALFKAWGIGKKGRDNGVLVLVAPTERKMRIEVGYGLEGVLPDGLAGEIIRTEFTPAFKNNDYPQGIVRGVQRIAEIVKADHTLTPEEVRRLRADANNSPPALLMIPFFALFIGPGAFGVGLGIRSKTGFPLLWGSIFGGVPMVMAFIPFFNASLLILGPLALGMLVWGYRKGESPYWINTLRNSSGNVSRNGWMMGGSSNSGGGSSSGGGGGFGGGSSGGGGASGSW